MIMLAMLAEMEVDHVDHVDLKKTPSCRENEGGDMCDRAMRHAAFPGKCGYKSETGGRLKERDAT